MYDKFTFYLLWYKYVRLNLEFGRQDGGCPTITG